MLTDLQRLFVGQILFVSRQVPEGGWGQARVRFFDSSQFVHSLDDRLDVLLYRLDGFGVLPLTLLSNVHVTADVQLYGGMKLKEKVFCFIGQILGCTFKWQVMVCR